MAINKPENKSVKTRYVGMIAKDMQAIKSVTGETEALDKLAKDVTEIILTYMYQDSKTDRNEMAKNMLAEK